jgi:PIF1-like helicase
LAQVRKEGDIALAVVASRIAALFLEGGRTAHSRFKIQFDVNETATCNINASSQSVLVNVRNCKLIIWDEAAMAHRYMFEAVDNILHDITKVNKQFGGDFGQILSVI